MKQQVNTDYWLPTEEQDAQILAAIEADPDTWIPTDEEFARMRPFSEVHPEWFAAWKEGNVRISTETLANMSDPPEPVTLTLDKGLLTYYRQTGDGWEQRLNDALRSVAFAGCDPRADTYASTNGCACRESVAA